MGLDVGRWKDKMLDIHENSGRCVCRYFDSLVVPPPGKRAVS
jgi:hypothetical protein